MVMGRVIVPIPFFICMCGNNRLKELQWLFNMNFSMYYRYNFHLPKAQMTAFLLDISAKTAGRADPIRKASGFG